MAYEIKLTGKPMEDRIRDHLNPSSEPQRESGAPHVTQGTSPNRVVTTIHHDANTRQHGEGVHGVDIHGNPRSVV